MRTPRRLGLGGLGCALLLNSPTALAEPPTSSPQANNGDDTTEPPRPPLPPEPKQTELAWNRHIEIGGDVALIARTVAADARVRYRPVVGYGVHARWEVFGILRFSAYFVDADHALQLFPNALVDNAEVSADEPVETIAFGGRLGPFLRLNHRARAWASVGIGYGRFSFGRMTVAEPGRAPFIVRERGMSFAEVPLGIGVSYDLIRNWLAIELETSGAFVLESGGEATSSAQAIDSTGRKRSINALPPVNASFVQTLGLSLVL